MRSCASKDLPPWNTTEQIEQNLLIFLKGRCTTKATDWTIKLKFDNSGNSYKLIYKGSKNQLLQQIIRFIFKTISAQLTNFCKETRAHEQNLGT